LRLSHLLRRPWAVRAPGTGRPAFCRCASKTSTRQSRAGENEPKAPERIEFGDELCAAWWLFFARMCPETARYSRCMRTRRLSYRPRWRCSQSCTNHSPRQFPANRENNRDFLLAAPGRSARISRAAGIFWCCCCATIAVGTGNSSAQNREFEAGNREYLLPPAIRLQAASLAIAATW
jgi:streptolysin S family bacteriocin protoxin